MMTPSVAPNATSLGQWRCHAAVPWRQHRRQVGGHGGLPNPGAAERALTIRDLSLTPRDAKAYAPAHSAMSQQISGVARSHRAAVGLRGVILAALAVTIATPIAPARSGQATAPAAPETTAQAPVAPALTRDQIREFLRTAKIIRGKDIPTGVTHPVRLTLSDGTLTHDAAFSTVDEHHAIERFEGGRVELDFVDSYKYTLAAYKIAELVGLGDMMPVH